MKFDQIIEKVDIKDCTNPDYEYLNFNVDEENKIEYQHGTKLWRLNGFLHREDGPAIEYSNGDKEWLLNGKLHRTDGPACEYSDGRKYWKLNGKRYSEKEFNKRVKNEI